MAISDKHREILREIGFAGATDGELSSYGRSRELGDLSHAGLIAFWHPHRPTPLTGIIGGAPGKWCLTIAGAAEADLPPLRFG